MENLAFHSSFKWKMTGSKSSGLKIGKNFCCIFHTEMIIDKAYSLFHEFLLQEPRRGNVLVAMLSHRLVVSHSRRPRGRSWGVRETGASSKWWRRGWGENISFLPFFFLPTPSAVVSAHPSVPHAPQSAPGCPRMVVSRVMFTKHWCLSSLTGRTCLHLTFVKLHWVSASMRIWGTPQIQC